MKARIPEEGEIRDDQVYHEGNWQTLDTGLTLYEVNQQLVAQLPNMTREKIEEKKEMFNNFLKKESAEYYMMLCKELSYYTIFRVLSNDYIGPTCFTEVVECLLEFTDGIKSITETDDGNAIEIWVKKDDTCHVVYFFNYTHGVIECLAR
jgi:hypothetical protein